MDEAEGPGHWTRRLGTSHQCLYLSSQTYKGYVRRQTRQEEVLAELQEERARLRCVLIHLAKGV